MKSCLEPTSVDFIYNSCGQHVVNAHHSEHGSPNVIGRIDRNWIKHGQMMQVHTPRIICVQSLEEPPEMWRATPKGCAVDNSQSSDMSPRRQRRQTEVGKTIPRSDTKFFSDTLPVCLLWAHLRDSVHFAVWVL